MGEVYLAQDTKLDRKVALKILPAEVATNRDRMDRFVREAKSAAALNHPNIAHVYEIGEDQDTHFIAMEFIDGDTLREKIHREKTPLKKLLKYLGQVAMGLAKAHGSGIVHRDLKPENIMITRDDYAKVLDFGLAKLVEPQRGFGASESASSDIVTAVMQQHSTPGMVMGTIGYMSPEQASGRVNEIDHRSDIFSFGCILFEAATGKRAFEGKDALDSLHKIVHAPTPQLKDVNPLAPYELQRLVRRCLAKEPEKRYQSIKELAIELDDLQEELKGVTASNYSASQASPAIKTTSGTSRTDEGFWVSVVPFKTRDDDPAVAGLAEGLSEEIVTGLSRFRYLSVVTSASAARLTGATEAERAKLGTRYVLEGSIRKGGSAIRVSAQLVDTETGARLWSENYNRDLQTSTIFEVQDDVAARIVATAADSYGVLVHSMRDAIRQKDDADLTPAEWQFQYFAYREQITPANHAALKMRLERTAKQDRRPSDFWACLAQVYLDEYAFGFPGDDGTSLDRALVAARRAVELDRANQFAMVALAQTHFFRQDLAAFGPAAERAMALNPLNTDALGILGLQIVHTGEFERGTAIVRRAMELNPNHPGWLHFAPLWDHFHKGEYEQALECANRVDVPGLFWPYLVMASACGHLDRRIEAEAAVRDLLALDPEFSKHARSNVATWHFASGLMEPLLEGLRKAGLDIGDEASASTASEPSLASRENRVGEGFRVAVLPFKFTGSNTEVATLAEGLSEEIVTGLSRFSYLRVISRSSALRYAKETDDVRDVGKTLGARYVMEGSLRVAGSSLRITVQLVDAGTGAHLWAETYDREFRTEEIFALQDDLVPRIVSTTADVNGVLPRSMCEAVCSRSPDELSPYEAVLRSFRYFDRVSAEELAAARSCLELAVEKAPTYGDAWAMLALLCVQDYAQGFDLQSDSLKQGRTAAQRAVEAAPSNHLAYFSLAQAHFFQKELQSFRHAAERAVALNPMDGNSLAFVGELLTYVGDSERGLALANRAKQINPNHPGWFWYADFFHAYRKGDYHGALSLILKANLPNHWGMHAGIAACAGQLGDRETATKAIRDLLKLQPRFGTTVKKALAKWFDPELCEQLLDGLRKAGLEIAGEEELTPDVVGEQGLGDVASLTKSGGSLFVTAFEGRPAIAVLPFENLSNDSEQEYFADGLAEDLITRLSLWRSFPVIARHSSFVYKGKAADLKKVSSELGVRYVVQGSVRKANNQVRISAQLTDSTTGLNVWAKTFDRELNDVFAVQDEISEAIAVSLVGDLERAEGARIQHRAPDSLEAWGLYQRALPLIYSFTREDGTQARSLLERAVALDPLFSTALARLAEVGVWEVMYEWTNDPARTLDAAIIQARRAIALDSLDAQAHIALSFALMTAGDGHGALEESRRALELNPSMPFALAIHAYHRHISGQPPQESIALVQRALRLSPHDPVEWLFYDVLASAFLNAGRFAEGFDAGRRLIALSPNYYWGYLWSAMNATGLGQIAEARKLVDEARRVKPELSLELALKCLGTMSPDVDRRFNEALRLTGLESKQAASMPPSNSSYETSRSEISDSQASAIKTIAVLPFQNLSGDPGQEYFADGVTEEIINALAQIRGLRVAGRSSSFSFKGRNEDLRSVGAKLNVATILEGTLRRSGDRLRITAQLIDASNGYQLWSERYDRVMADVFALQDEIANTIAGRLQLSLVEPVQGEPVQPPTRNIGAYELYLKGRGLLYQRGLSIPKAIDCFTEAVALDPLYAQAWAGLADGYTTSGYSGLKRPIEVMPRALEAARRALELDRSVAEAHNALACASLLYERDYLLAEREFQQALKLNPNYPQARAWYGLFFLDWAAGRTAEARDELQRLLQIDPLSGYANVIYSFSNSSNSRIAEAVDHARRGVELDPGSYLALWSLAVALECDAKYEEASAVAERALAMSGRHCWALATLTSIYGAWGKADSARAVYQEMEVRRVREYIQPGMLSIAAAAAGEVDRAIEFAQEAVDERDPVFVLVARSWPEYDRLRTNPRFLQIVSQLELPGWSNLPE